MSDAASTPSPIPLKACLGIAGALLVFVVIAAYSARQAADTPDYDSQRAAVRYATLAKLRAEDQQTLTTAAWVDQGKGVIRVPIVEAMPQEVAVLQAKPVQMGQPIPGAAPAPKPAPPAATAMPGPAAPSPAPAPTQEKK